MHGETVKFVMYLYMFRALNAHLQEVTLYTRSIWYRHSLREFVVVGRYTYLYLFTDSGCLFVGYPCVWLLIILRAASFESNQHDTLPVEFILWINEDKEGHLSQLRFV